MTLLKKFYSNINIIFKKIVNQKKYYSFSGVDIIIENIFKKNNKGIYLDVGCQHPIKNNNTYLLSKKGWTGINIDLDRDNIDLFNVARPKDDNINIAVSNKVGETDLYFYHKKSPINTIEKKTSDFQKAKVTDIRKVKTNTLNNIINNSKFKNKKINLLSVDVEGHELQVLEGIDFNFYKPDVIVVEFLDLSAKKLEIKNLNTENVFKTELYKYLISKNYVLVNCIYSDLIFINTEFRD
tara:strand:+ start:358 stop:1074 length:717 start_codon:yes stop_codon:yes gene_type:complete